VGYIQLSDCPKFVGLLSRSDRFWVSLEIWLAARFCCCLIWADKINMGWKVICGIDRWVLGRSSHSCNSTLGVGHHIHLHMLGTGNSEQETPRVGSSEWAERGQNRTITAALNEKGEGYDRYGESRTTNFIERDIILIPFIMPIPSSSCSLRLRNRAS